MAYNKREDLPPFPHRKDVNGAPMPHDIHVVNGSIEMFRFPVYLIENGKRKEKPLEEIWSSYTPYSDLTITVAAEDDSNILEVKVTAQITAAADPDLQNPKKFKVYPYNIIGTRASGEKDCILHGNVVIHGAPYSSN